MMDLRELYDSRFMVATPLPTKIALYSTQGQRKKHVSLNDILFKQIKNVMKRFVTEELRLRRSYHKYKKSSTGQQKS